MRVLGLAALVLVGVAAVSGCGRKQTYYGPGGKVTVNAQAGGKSVQVETDTGKATVDTSKKAITEAELGAPVYPGAQVELSGSYEGAGSGQSENVQHHVLTTPDSFDQVFAFYKSKLKNVQNTMNQSAGDGQLAMFMAKSDDGSDLSVQITTDKDKKVTRVQVIKAKKP